MLVIFFLVNIGQTNLWFIQSATQRVTVPEAAAAAARRAPPARRWPGTGAPAGKRSRELPAAGAASAGPWEEPPRAERFLLQALSCCILVLF